MSDITNKILRLAKQLDAHKFPLDDLCYLVSKDEWDALVAEMKSFERFTSGDTHPEGMLHSMKIGFLEVRQR